MMAGYAYEYTGDNWIFSSDEDWETIMYTPNGNEVFVGKRLIDDSMMNIFRGDNSYLAQLVTFLPCSREDLHSEL